jgi:phage terminase large subunit-like protein
MSRNVRRLDTHRRQNQLDQTIPFSEFSSTRNLILLGERGSGKSRLFFETAAAEGAVYVKARAILTRPTQTFSRQSLFIDALDERRAGSR